MTSTQTNFDHTKLLAIRPKMNITKVWSVQMFVVGGGGGGWWLRPILVFSLSLDQAEQKSKLKSQWKGLDTA